MKSSGKVIIFSICIWTAVAFFDFVGDFFFQWLRYRPFYWKDSFPFASSWLTWVLLTPFAINYAGRKYYIDDNLSGFLRYHFIVYVILNILQVILASTYILTITNTFSNLPLVTGVFYKKLVSGTFYNLTVYAILLLIINNRKYHKDLQAEQARTFLLEKKLHESRMQFLEQQLQPHFLFNTHHSIITLMKINMKEKAIEMMEKLSDLLRFALKENKAQLILLRKEIELLQLYIDIQKIRFEDKLQVNLQIQSEANDVCVPAMILQPLIENAIKHGVETSPKPTEIKIIARVIEGWLTLNVENSVSFISARTKNGIGIKNTSERLYSLYGENHKFSYQLIPGEVNLFRITIEIPAQNGKLL
jgi:sensor histidine kinase YesM